MQNQPPVINIQMVPAGVEYVLSLLNKQPREQSDPLFKEIEGQYLYQLQELQKAAQAAEAAKAAARAPTPAAANEAPSAPSEPAAEASVGGAE